MNATATDQLPVVVIGAGPAGLAAAHLLDRGLEPLVLEAGTQAGAAVQEWSHVRLFSVWGEVVDPVAEKVLAPTDWVKPAADTYPTGGDWADGYLQPLADPGRHRRLRHAGLPALGERAAADRVSYRVPDLKDPASQPSRSPGTARTPVRHGSSGAPSRATPSVEAAPDAIERDGERLVLVAEDGRRLAPVDEVIVRPRSSSLRSSTRTSTPAAPSTRTA